MSDLYFNEQNDYSEEHSSENEDFRSTILQPFLFERVVNRNRNRKKRVVTRDMTKKLNIFTLQLPIYYILEYEISIGSNADIATTKREK